MKTITFRLLFKNELLHSSAASSDARNEVEILQLSEPNKIKFLELLEKLAETEDFNKSLTTILEVKEDEIKAKDAELNKLKSHSSCLIKSSNTQSLICINSNEMQVKFY